MIALRPARPSEAALISTLALRSKAHWGYDEAFLEVCFVDPPAIGTGVGAAPLRHALAEAGRRGWRTLLLDADPGAVGFYQRFGAHRVGEVPSGSIPGWVLPRLALDVGDLRVT